MAGYERLYLDYFSNSLVYQEKVFRRRFRMSRSLFLNIISKVKTHDPYFVQNRNGGKKLGLSSLQKITVALRMLAYGVMGDFMDEYVRIGETTALQSLEKFVIAMVDIFSEEYLRKPNNEDIATLLAHEKRRGFPGMLGSIDCIHWKWKIVHVHGKVNIVVIFVSRLLFRKQWHHMIFGCHAFFGLSESNNDINGLE